MKVMLELDTSGGEAAHRAARDVLDRLYGLNAASAPSAPAAAPLAPQAPAAPTPAPTGPIPSAAPAPAAAPAPTAAAIPPATTAPVAPPAPSASPSGITTAQFTAAVQAYATAYKPAGTKARFKQMSDAFVQAGNAAAAGWTSIGAIPASEYEAVLPWFAVQ